MWKITLYLTCVMLVLFVMINSHTAFSACAWYDIMCKFQSKNETSGVNSNVTTGTTNPTDTSIPPTTSSQNVKQQSSNCDPSYPDFCIPSPPPDLNCADIPQKRFTVTGSDPHGFDRDGDGIACES